LQILLMRFFNGVLVQCGCFNLQTKKFNRVFVLSSRKTVNYAKVFTCDFFGFLWAIVWECEEIAGLVGVS